MKANLKTPKITEHLNKTSISLASVFDKANLLHQLNQVFLANVDCELAKHCKVANYRSGVLIIEVESAAWAMQIRYRTSELIKNLHGLKEFKRVERIECYILPTAILDKKANQRPSLSSESAELLIATSDSIKSPRLKQALQRLARK